MEPACQTCGTHLRRVDGVCPTCVARSITSLLGIAQNRENDDVAVPGYALHEAIGRGGMGVVFRATREADGVIVAVKVLPAHLVDHEEVADRFAREAHALAAFDHPHVLRVLDSGITADGRLFLVTEFAVGGDLARRLQRGALPLVEARRMFGEVLDAIAEAHRQGIAHRDIKPANILLDADDGVRVGDFSLAKLLRDGASPQLTLTQSADVFGTPYYIAPEVRHGAGSVDERADIFSLGVLLHEMLTGRVPIGNYEPASRIAKVPHAVDRLIACCLHEDPAKRPQTITHLRRDLDAAWKSRPRITRLAALLVGGLLLAAAVISSRQRTSVAPPVIITPLTATKARPWSNSLGMPFVPVPGTKVLFSVWETRRADFTAFAAAQPGLGTERGWEHPEGVITPEHPVCYVSWLRAEQFCHWLTRKEHESGTLPLPMRYRLPSDLEWSAAVGLPAESGTTPEERHAKLGPMEHAPYPWGRSWPPPATNFPANFAGQEAINILPAFAKPALAQRDAWPRTAPVGSFPANELGIYDLSGNASEWCLDAWNQTLPDKTLRGGAWNQTAALALRLDGREHATPPRQMSGVGFRVVIAAE